MRDKQEQKEIRAARQRQRNRRRIQYRDGKDTDGSQMNEPMWHKMVVHRVFWSREHA